YVLVAQEIGLHGKELVLLEEQRRPGERRHCGDERGERRDDPAARAYPGVARERKRHNLARRRRGASRIALDRAFGHRRKRRGDPLDLGFGMAEEPPQDRPAGEKEHRAQERHDEERGEEDEHDEPRAVLEVGKPRKGDEETRRGAETEDEHTHPRSEARAPRRRRIRPASVAFRHVRRPSDARSAALRLDDGKDLSLWQSATHAGAAPCSTTPTTSTRCSTGPPRRRSSANSASASCARCARRSRPMAWSSAARAG